MAATFGHRFNATHFTVTFFVFMFFVVFFISAVVASLSQKLKPSEVK